MALLKDLENAQPIIDEKNYNTDNNKYNICNLIDNNHNTKTYKVDSDKVDGDKVDGDNSDNNKLNDIFNIYKKNLFDIGIKSQQEIKTDNYQTFIKTNKNIKNIPHKNPKLFTHFNNSTFEDRLNNPASFGPLSKRYKMAQLKQFLDENERRREMKNIIEEDLDGLFNFY